MPSEPFRGARPSGGCLVLHFRLSRPYGPRGQLAQHVAFCWTPHGWIFASAISPPTVHLAMSGVCGFHSWRWGCMLLASGGWGPGMLPRVLQGTGHPLCGAALLRRSQLCGGRELALLVLRACPPGPPAAKPCRATCGAHGFGVGVRGARSRAGDGVDGAGDLQPARCWELESRSRLCRPMQVCARLPVCFLVPETWCPLHRTGTRQDTSGGRGEQRRQRSAVIPSSVSVRAGFWPRATNPVQHELWGAVGPGTVTECSAGVTKLPRRCPC